MSKGTVRLPESAIVDGHVGTSRVREQIARAAAQLASVDPAPLDAAMRAFVGSAGQSLGTIRTAFEQAGFLLSAHAPLPLSPMERMQQLGRQPRGKMNKTEAAYAQLLDAQLAAGEILWYRFEGIKLRLADRTFITVDFAVIPRGAPLEFHEVKGRWTDDARAKTKIAAAQYPFRFIAIQRAGRHGWRIEDLTSRSW